MSSVWVAERRRPRMAPSSKECSGPITGVTVAGAVTARGSNAPTERPRGAGVEVGVEDRGEVPGDLGVGHGDGPPAVPGGPEGGEARVAEVLRGHEDHGVVDDDVLGVE